MDNDGCCFPSGCALAPSVGCFCPGRQPCCVPDSRGRKHAEEAEGRKTLCKTSSLCHFRQFARVKLFTLEITVFQPFVLNPGSEVPAARTLLPLALRTRVSVLGIHPKGTRTFKGLWTQHKASHGDQHWFPKMVENGAVAEPVEEQQIDRIDEVMQRPSMLDVVQERIVTVKGDAACKIPGVIPARLCENREKVTADEAEAFWTEILTAAGSGDADARCAVLAYSEATVVAVEGTTSTVGEVAKELERTRESQRTRDSTPASGWSAPQKTWPSSRPSRAPECTRPSSTRRRLRRTRSWSRRGCLRRRAP